MNKKAGVIGEKLAANFLLKNGYYILQRNFRSKLGEIDIIAKKDSRIHFVEVKTRIGIQKGLPHEAVNFNKIKHLKRTLQLYVKENSLNDYKQSLDVVSIVLNNSYEVENFKFFENITR